MVANLWLAHDKQTNKPKNPKQQMNEKSNAAFLRDQEAKSPFFSKVTQT